MITPHFTRFLKVSFSLHYPLSFKSKSSVWLTAEESELLKERKFYKMKGLKQKIHFI